MFVAGVYACANEAVIAISSPILTALSNIHNTDEIYYYHCSLKLGAEQVRREKELA